MMATNRSWMPTYKNPQDRNWTEGKQRYASHAEAVLSARAQMLNAGAALFMAVETSDPINMRWTREHSDEAYHVGP